MNKLLDLPRIKYMLFTFTCLLAGTCASSQVADSLQKRFVDFAGKRLQEKIYVQTDKQFFLSGEIIWLKLYVVDAM